MPTRKTTAEAIANLGPDKSNEVARAEILASVPPPVFHDHIPFTSIRRDRKLNVRDDSSYGYTANQKLWESLKEFGLQMRNPMMSFSRQSDGTLLTISGNIRGDCMEGIRQQEAERRAKEGIPTTPDNPLPFEYIHGLIWEGLTTDQEHCLVTDQVLSKGLDEFEIAKSIGENWERNPGMSVQRMAVWFGMEKNMVHRLRMRYCMPTVFAEYRKEKGSADVPYVKVGQKALTALYTAYLADREAGNKHREEGPNFARAWKELLTDPSVFGKKPEREKPEDKAKSAEIVANQATGCVAAFGDTPEIKAVQLVLLWTLGEANPENGEPINLNTVQTDLKAYCDTLRSEREASALAAEKLHNELESAKHDISALQAERDHLAECTRIDAETIATLRTDLESARSKPHKVKS